MRVYGSSQCVVVALSFVVSGLILQPIPEGGTNSIDNDIRTTQCQYDGSYCPHEQSTTVSSTLSATPTSTIQPTVPTAQNELTRRDSSNPPAQTVATATAAIATLSPSHVITALSSHITASSSTASIGGPPITFQNGDILSVAPSNILLSHAVSGTTTIDTYAFPTPTSVPATTSTSTSSSSSSASASPSQTKSAGDEVIDSAIAALTPTIMGNTAVALGSQTLTLNGPGVTMTAPNSEVTEVVNLLPQGVVVAFPGGEVRTFTLSVPISWSGSSTGDGTAAATQTVSASSTSGAATTTGSETSGGSGIGSESQSETSSQQTPMGSLIYNALNGVNAGERVEVGYGGAVAGVVFLLCVYVLVV